MAGGADAADLDGRQLAAEFASSFVARGARPEPGPVGRPVDLYASGGATLFLVLKTMGLLS